MQKLLVVKSSILGQNGNSNAMADHFIAKWSQQNPGGTVVIRDLAENPIPHLTGQRFGALVSDPSGRTEVQQAVVDESDVLIEELKTANTVVFAAPMYNLGIPSTLKAYFDHVTRAGVTFKYSAKGVEGMLGDREVVVLTSRGGIYVGTAADVQAPYLHSILGFLGMTDVRYVFAEGLALGEESRESSLKKARSEIDALLSHQELAAA